MRWQHILQMRESRQQAAQDQLDIDQGSQVAKAAGQATPALKEVIGG